MNTIPMSGHALCAALCLLATAAMAQTNLAPVTVTTQAYVSHHGGYRISGDFRVDARMPSVVFPAQALVKDDILSVQPVHLQDDEYLVLQECATANCSEAALVRVWNADGAAGEVQNSENRIWIRHENKYFLWLKRLPEVGGFACAQCGAHYTSFERASPPLMLIPDGRLTAYNKSALAAAERADPVPVQSTRHEGSTYVVTYQGGSTVRIRRMHAAN